jgi:hypothetical protein
MYGYLLVLVIIIIAIWAYTTSKTENLNNMNTRFQWEVTEYGNPICYEFFGNTVMVAARSGKVYIGSCKGVAPRLTSPNLSEITRGTNPVVIQNGSTYRIYLAGLAKYKGQWRVIGDYDDPSTGKYYSSYLFPAIPSPTVVRDILGNNYEACNSRAFNDLEYAKFMNQDYLSAQSYFNQSAPEMTDLDVSMMLARYNELVNGGKIDGSFNSSFQVVSTSTLTLDFVDFCRRSGVNPGQEATALFLCDAPKNLTIGGDMYYYNTGIADDVARRYMNLGKCALQVESYLSVSFPGYPAMFNTYYPIDTFKGWAHTYLIYGPAINPPKDFITALCNPDLSKAINPLYLLTKEEEKGKYYRYNTTLPIRSYNPSWNFMEFQAGYVSNINQINYDSPIRRNTRLIPSTQRGITGFGENTVGLLSQSPTLCAQYGITVGGAYGGGWTWIHPRMTMTQADNDRMLFVPGDIVADNSDYRLPTNVYNGRNIRDSSTGAVYFVEKGMLRHYPNSTIYASWGSPAYSNFSHADIVGTMLNSNAYKAGAYKGPPMTTSKFPQGIVNGMNIRDPSNGGIYHLMYDQKLWFDWPTYVSWGKPSYVDITAAEAAAIPNGPKMFAKTLPSQSMWVVPPNIGYGYY